MTQERRDPLQDEIEASLEGVNLQEIERDPSAPASGGQRDRRLQRGTVVGITGQDVFVELGPRMQGVCQLAEFDPPPQPGQTFEFTLRGREDELWLLSRREAASIAGWNELEVGSTVKARVSGTNTGGLELTVGPGRAFMPASHVALGREEDLGRFLGQTLLCEVIELDRDRGRVVVSRRAVLEREREQARAEAMEGLQAGDLVRGKVTRVESFGAFVEVASGVEGLVHVSNLSRQRVEDVSERLSVGQEVEALVLEITEGGRRIALGMKQLEPDPWDEAVHLLQEGSVVPGKVVRLMDFGAFVELAPGLEGLLHVSQIARDRVRRVQDHVKVGEELTVRVLSVDPDARRIALSRLDEGGAVIGSEDAADREAIEEVLRPDGAPLRTNLGDLFRRALEDE